MSKSDENRRCEVDHVKCTTKDCIFKCFGNEIVYGDDNNPHDNTVAFIEIIETGELIKVSPTQVRFIE